MCHFSRPEWPRHLVPRSARSKEPVPQRLAVRGAEGSLRSCWGVGFSPPKAPDLAAARGHSLPRGQRSRCWTLASCLSRDAAWRQPYHVPQKRRFLASPSGVQSQCRNPVPRLAEDKATLSSKGRPCSRTSFLTHMHCTPPSFVRLPGAQAPQPQMEKLPSHLPVGRNSPPALHAVTHAHAACRGLGLVAGRGRSSGPSRSSKGNWT